MSKTALEEAEKDKELWADYKQNWLAASCDVKRTAGFIPRTSALVLICAAGLQASQSAPRWGSTSLNGHTGKWGQTGWWKVKWCCP